MYKNDNTQNRYNRPNNKVNERPSFAPARLPMEFETKGFLELREELLVNECKEIAKLFYDEKLSGSQLRLFFGEVRALQSRIDGNEENFKKVYPYILILKSKTEYKYRNGQKGTARIPKIFRDFMDVSINHIIKDKTLDSFENFCLVFETIIGYYYGFGGSDK